MTGKDMKKPHVQVLIAAAGSGSRMQAAVNKQLLEMAGLPVLAHTLNTFESHLSIDDIFIIAAPVDLPAYEQLQSRYNWSKLRGMITGGKTRQDSVHLGLRHLKDTLSDPANNIILVHDGARCLIDHDTVNRVINGILQHKACGAAIPVRDTIKITACDRRVISTPERSQLWAMQTPQGAFYPILYEAYEKAAADMMAATDDLAVLENYGLPVYVVEGSEQNIKLTTPLDLQLAELIYRRQNNINPL
jgi:2-C-methyl-D-erythritol 4-phosphate cytidylyltransferase